MTDHELVYRHKFQKRERDDMFGMQCEVCSELEEPTNEESIPYILLAILRKL